MHPAAKGTCILHGIVGSTAHGLSVAGMDDVDEMGVCIEPPNYVIGLDKFEQSIWRSQPAGTRSGPGDRDVVIYSLRKWMRLALKSNPTVLLLFFLPPEFLLHRDSLGDRLQNLAPKIVSREAFRPFYGYMAAQRQRLLGERGQKRVKRPEYEAKYGYDTKYAMHMLRLGFQGVELLKTGRISLPMPDHERSLLLKVRNGEMDLPLVMFQSGLLEHDLLVARRDSMLRASPDRRAANEFLIDAYQQFWGYKEGLHGTQGA